MLLDRLREREALDHLIAAARDGLSGVLVVRGEPGVGKTSLLEYAVESATDLRVVRAIGTESEMDLGFAGLHQLLSPFLDQLDRLPTPQRNALASAFGLTHGMPADRFLIGLATLTLLSDASGDRPLLCAIDDAQWLDQESVEILAFVARRLFADRIAMLFNLRDTLRRTPLDRLPDLRLSGLPDEHALELLSSVVPGRLDPQVADRIVTETGGNPLALAEFAGELTPVQLAGGGFLPEHLPLTRRLEARFLRRVRGMPAETQTGLLLAAAVQSGDPVVLWRAAAYFGVSADAMAAAEIEELVNLRPHVRFRHPLIRSAVYGGASEVDRRRVHEVLASVTDHERDPDRRAWHLAAAAAGPDEQVATELERCADRARSRGGYAAVATFLSRAAELTPDPQHRSGRLLAAATAHLTAGTPARAQAFLDQVAASGDALVDALAERLQGAILFMMGSSGKAPPLLLHAASTLQAIDGRLSRDTSLEALEAAVVGGRFIVGMTLFDVARAVAPASTVPNSQPTIVDVLLEGFATRIAIGYAQAAPVFRRAIAMLNTDAAPSDEEERWSFLACIAAQDLWDEEVRTSILSRLAKLQRERGALSRLRYTLGSLAQCEMTAGRFAEADACFVEPGEITMAMGEDDASWAVGRVGLLAWQGRQQEARRLIAVTIHKATEITSGATVALAHVALTILELGLARYREALACARYVYDDDTPGMGSEILPNLVEAGVGGDDRRAATAALDRLTERALASGTPLALGLLARSRALMADDDHAEALYREAIDHLTGTPTELSRAHLLYGEWLRRQRRRSDARVQLRTAYDQFTAMGAEAFGERARAELLALGEQTRERTPTTPHDLTPQETQVARLAAQGATNREIATQLFISASTVEYHLRKIFRKFDITSRRQLTRALFP